MRTPHWVHSQLLQTGAMMQRLPLWVLRHQKSAHEFPPLRCCKFLYRHSPFAAFNNVRSNYTTVSTSAGPDPFAEVEYAHIENVEMMERYRPGGYHLVSIGDKLQARYRVLHKLGHGGYSTTWLARDEYSRRLVAVKVGTAGSNPREVHVLSALAAQNPKSVGSPGRAMIPLVLDDFTIQGPNGVHPCCVTAPARASLSDVLDAPGNGMFELDVARALVVRLTLAVIFIHSQGFVHGDIHLRNVLLRLSSTIDLLSDEELYEKYGRPSMEPVVRFDGQELPPGIPTHGIVPVWLGESSDKVKFPEAKIFLIDFGEAFAPSQEAKYVSNTPVWIRPPEARFEPEKPLSFSSDIWSLACAIWEILGQRPLFDPWLAAGDNVTCEQVDALGILPPEWWCLWKARTKWFDDNGTPLDHRKDAHTLEARFEFSTQEPRRKAWTATFEQDEKDSLLAMLRSMLLYKPEDRLTAAEVLESEWMIKWALPEYEKIR